MQWNDGKKETAGEFAGLSKPVTDARPGKLARAPDSKADVARSPACTTTLTGTHRGPLTVTAGVSCLDRAHCRARSARPGVALVGCCSPVAGPLSAGRARAVRLCGTIGTGPVAIAAATGPVRLGGTGRTANAFSGLVRLVGDSRQVTLYGNTVVGPLPGYGSQPALDDAGRPNMVSGPKSGRCATV
ncbi:hypothetical protein AB5J72_44390 [Streptomyces sp. CG1]|uniref:hypothetical protein n=1 Tax=Streptomyces sp. CG1 TaxID=1287523 RepID=UPI0034E19F67